jgi:tetratricopeptide (TPR) repeat protein
MVRIRFLLLAMLFSATAFAQKKPADYFEEANSYYDAGQYDKALKGYQYFVKHFPKDQGYPRALYNAAHCQFLLKQYGKCVKTCRKLMAVEADEKDPLGWGIMADP